MERPLKRRDVGQSLAAVGVDLFALAKPRLSSLVLVTTLGGLLLAPGTVSWQTAALTLVMTMASVASANTLNCYLERDTDGRMHRTRSRPLPSGRVSGATALALGLTLGLVSVPALWWGVGPMAGGLSLLAIASYVLVYTPLKYQTPWAVVVGGLPGAIPPLLGWTAVTGRLDAAGLTLFAVLFLWQMPHFLAIALYLQEDYARAGIRVLPLTHGPVVTRRWIVVTALLLIPATLALWPLGVAGPVYAGVAGLLGLWFVQRAVRGWRTDAGPRWARALMLDSVAYLSLLFIALAIGATWHV